MGELIFFTVFWFLGVFGTLEKEDKVWTRRTLGWALFFLVVMGFWRVVGMFTLDKLPEPAARTGEARLVFGVMVGLCYSVSRAAQIQARKFPFIAALWETMWVMGWVFLVLELLSWLVR